MSDSVRPHRWQLTRLPHPWDSPGKNTEVGRHFLLQCMKVKSERKVAQSYPTFSNPMDCSPPGSSVRGFLQARILEWVAISVSRGSSKSRDYTQVSCIAGRFFTFWATRKSLSSPVATAKFSSLLTHWVQHFNSIIFWDFNGFQLSWNSITSTSFFVSNTS